MATTCNRCAILNCIDEPDLYFRVSGGLGKRRSCVAVVVLIVVATIVAKQ